VTLRDAESAHDRAAQVIAEHARDAVAARGRFLFAASGGSTPRRMLQALAEEDIPWAQEHVFQLDERVTPDGHSQRNLTQLPEAPVLQITSAGEDAFAAVARALAAQAG